MDDKGLGEEGALDYPSPLPEEEEKKRPIEDPWHSRVLDVHRWSDHREIVTVVEGLWASHFAHLDTDGRSGPKPKRSFKHQFRVLILDLYVAWLEDPELSIGVSMSQNDWQTWSRYNALNISKKILPLILSLAELGLIDLAKGSYGGSKALGNRTTRIRAAEPLRVMFRGLGSTRDDVHQVENQECIVLKSGEGDAARLVDYEDTDQTHKMRRDLVAYNSLLASSYIDIPGLDDPWVTRRDARGREFRVHIDHHHQFVRRIFSRGDWSCNGRFYGPWWQQIDKTLRAQIFINDTPTVEVDFKGLHVAILSAERGVTIEGDPYELPAGLVPGALPELQRILLKKLVLTALNANSEQAAFASFREGFPTGHMAKGLTNKDLGGLLVAFARRHPHLVDCLCADQGIRLMNLDGQIAEIVQRFFTRRGIPVLSVHDSFIIDYTHVGDLKIAMGLAAERVVGKPLALEANGLGLDEMTDDPAVVLDYQTWREPPRGTGYLDRLSRWEGRKGEEVVPYGRRN
jgi:hypothetical protein